jgi:hypothetical protein
MKILIFCIIFFHTIVNINCQQYVPRARSMHTATLIGTKIYFFGGAEDLKVTKFLNDFFYLDISKSFDKEKKELPFVDLTDKALEIPPHFGAATTVFGALKDSIFFFGGEMGKSNDPSRLTYSFNTTQVKWKIVTVSQGVVPIRKQLMQAVTDNNDKVYIFGGGFINNPDGYFSKGMVIFDTINKIWTNGEDGVIGRDGHTATFLPDTGEIIYIGGVFSDGQSYVLVDIANVCLYIMYCIYLFP